MGISKSLFTNVARTIFNVAGDGVKGAIYHQDGLEIYDPDTRKVSQVDSYREGVLEDEDKDHQIDVIEEKFLNSQYNNSETLEGDTQYLIIQDDFIIVPQANAHITVEGVKYIIKAVGKDLMNVMWILHCRA